MKTLHLACLAFCVLLSFALRVNHTEAYPRYYNDAEEPGSNCTLCHGAFTGPESPTGAEFPSDSKHTMHNGSSYMDAECNSCHTNGDSRNPYLGSSQGTSNNPGFGCVGCHGRAGDDGKPVADTTELSGMGAGLRQHHFRVGQTECLDCHADSDPAKYTPVGEHENPPYYNTPDSNVKEPCNPVPTTNLNENWTLNDFFGLDNDGDLLYDAADGDCGTVEECPDNDNDGYAVCGGSCEPNVDDECGDCDDNNATVNPAGVEETGQPSCTDGLDNDCDGLADAEDTDCDPVTVLCEDNDNDGYVFCDGECQVPDGKDCGDCDDNAAAVNPDATETCDGIDNDCDDLIDDADPGVTGQPTWYADSDGDGYGDPGSSQMACDMPTGFVSDNTDCNDTASAANPGATEGPSTDPTCDDGLDNDCDGLADTDDPGCDPVVADCPDGDGDGYVVCGDCQVPDGKQCGDCDDAAAAVNPDATETCDGIDNDCDDLVDDADTGVTGQSTWYADSDGDGYGDSGSSQMACDMPADHVSDNTDCDDTASAVNPNATEACDGIDNDCDDLVDDDDTGVTGQSTWYADSDGDGYGDPVSSQMACNMPTGYVSDDTDCNDMASAANPGATEGPSTDPTCDDGLDNDCDALVDTDDPGCDPVVADCPDGDGDGYVVCGDCQVPDGKQCGDCDDAAAAVNPDATETCDGIDNDCDDLVDDADTGVTGQSTWYADGDGDGYGNPGVSQMACTMPEGYVTDNTDCHDSASTVNPGASEICDGVDNDCDFLVDDADPGVTGQSTWYADSDGDGFGDPGGSEIACDMPDGFVSDNTDCNDASSAVNPGATEGPSTDPTCDDGLDNDCDTLVDIADPGCESTVVFCDDNDGDDYVVCDRDCQVPDGKQCGDCDDTASAVNPGATEGPSTDPTCDDGLDNDCDTLFDTADPDCESTVVFCDDNDGDDYAVCDRDCQLPDGKQCGDCDDTDAFVNPAASEGPYMDPTCGDDLDNDCDGFVDADDSSCMGSMLSDYDLKSFRCSPRGRVGKRISLRVSIDNQGSIDPGTQLTVFGERADGAIIPIVMNLEVFEPAGNGHARLTFTYTPTADDVGKLTWRAGITDETPGAEDDGQDTATCTTTVTPGKGPDDMKKIGRSARRRY